MEESWFLRRRLISTEEADSYGGGSFLRRKLISTQEADFHWGGQFLSNRLIFVWKTRKIAQRKQGFNPERVCFTVCSSGTSGPRTNKSEWNNCFSKNSNRVLPPIFISTILQSVRKEHTTSGHTRPDSRHHLVFYAAVLCLVTQRVAWRDKERLRRRLVITWLLHNKNLNESDSYANDNLSSTKLELKIQR